MVSGSMNLQGTSVLQACAMEAFWQNAQRMLQPYEPIERMLDPGMKRASGFFSIGSSASEVMRP